MRIGRRRKPTRLRAIVLGVWLLIGVVAAGQRGYYEGGKSTCRRFGTIAVTILAGPLNYLGANPKVSCKVPQPSE